MRIGVKVTSVGSNQMSKWLLQIWFSIQTKLETMFVTGDYHSFWQATLTPDFDDPAAPVVANEFAAGASGRSITIERQDPVPGPRPATAQAG